MRDDLIPLLVHPSQIPERVHATLVQSLSSRQIDHQFHYSTPKQAEQWLRIFQSYSPFRNDSACRQIYEESCRAVSRRVAGGLVHVIGLGCGSAEKDLRLLQDLKTGGTQTVYTALDVSPSLALTAYENVKRAGFAQTPAVVCDLKAVAHFSSVLDGLPMPPPNAHRILTFFGLMPNFEPESILSVLESFARADDLLLVSANTIGDQLLPSMQSVLPQYDNEPTNQWLLTFLLDLGVNRSDGLVEWEIQPHPSESGVARFVASFVFTKPVQIAVANETFAFNAGERMQLFYSYRYTPTALNRVFGQHKLEVEELWLTPSAEEAVWLCRNSS